MRARWSRNGGELTIAPRDGAARGRRFQTVVAYDGVPASRRRASGFIPTDDGALIAGEPDVAATWFPVNDHPSDTATYSFRITVPRGLEAVANGELEGVVRPRPRTTWKWEAREPLAPYLATASMASSSCAPTKRTGSSTGTRSTPTCSTQPKPRTGAGTR